MKIDGPGTKVTSDWDAYWQNTRLNTTGRQEGGPRDAELDRFWTEFFAEQITSQPVRLLDIACGLGPVLRHALAKTGSQESTTNSLVIGLDASTAALVETRSRSPGSVYVAASGARLPFTDAQFDLVTSQFGIEYAGTEAFQEMCRVLVPGGTFSAILHLHEGRIYRESRINLDAANAFLDSGLLSGLAGIFNAAIALHQSGTDTRKFRAADQSFAASVMSSEAVIRQWGKGAADGLLFSVYNDVGHIYSRFKHYEPREVLEWITLVTGELQSYAGRMASMLTAALDQSALNNLLTRLSENQLHVISQGVIRLGSPPVDSAWTLVAKKQ